MLNTTEDRPIPATAQQSGVDAARAMALKYAALPPERRSVLRAKVREQGIDPTRLPIVPLTPEAQEHADRYPLSAAQARLWFLWKLDPLNPAYNLARAVRLTGQLDVSALRAAFAALIARHGALRARFVEERGVAVQRIAHAVPHGLDDGYGWREHTLDDPAALPELLRRAAREPFDLGAGPLLRADLVRLAADRWTLLISTHHIVSDGWSQALIVRELVALYRAALDGGETARALPPLALHFGDVSAWQAEWQDATQAADLAFWLDRLGTAQPELELPLDRPRTPARSIEGGRRRVEIGEALAARLRQLARARRTTLFTVLLGAWAALLHRYGGQTAIRIGVPSAGRGRRETEALVGYFVNTLVIEAEVDGAMPFDRLLAALHVRVLEAQAHRDVPFGKILDALKIERDLGRSPLFQVMFNLEQGSGETAVALPGLVVEPETGSTETARFDLVLNVVDEGRALKLSFNFAADVFDEATVARVAAQYEAILAQLADDETRRVGELTLPEAARVQEARVYGFASLADSLVAQARRSPDAVALRCEQQSLTYAELERWSGALAAQLVARGVRAETRVGLCVERGVGMIAALIGVIRSGGAFVPLDPEYPQARLEQMIEDAGITRVVADARSAARLADVLHGCEVVDVDAARDVSGDAPTVTFHPEQLAYVLYTSGSTGRPKGVAVSHDSLWTHLEDFQSTYQISAQDTVLHSSTINFDVALHEILPALRVGATVEMRGIQPWDLQSLSERVSERRVTFARIPTALWQQWQRHAPARESLSLRQVTVGGEALPGDALRHWKESALADIRLDNLYGPTETTVAALYRETTVDDTKPVTVPIGKPYPGRSARVIDAFGDEAPAGGLGELCIGGPTVSRGYLGRAALTAERFVPDPSGVPGSRQYRSGDLCRMRADGTVEFLGRLDQQVKLRGQRIELGEIEAVLRHCAGVREAAVIVHGAGEKQRLAGYVAGEVDIATLQRELESRLPGYMVPSSLTVLDKLPVMPNGKLDRKALPQPQEPTGERIAATNATEATLLSIWQTVLGRDDIGVTDNFFEVGGDSIQSLQIIARARETGLVLTPRQVFEHPTVARLAACATTADDAADTGERNGPLPLTPIQRWFFERYPHGESHWNQSVLLTVEGALDVAALERAVRALAVRHDALRLRFTRSARGWTQHVAAMNETAGEPVLQRIAVKSLDDMEAACDALQASLDLQAGPLWRVGVIEAGEARRVLIVIHHLAVDGVSWRVLLADLQLAYEQAERGETPALAVRSTPWSAWAARLDEYASRPERLAELSWWQTALDVRAATPLRNLRAEPTETTSRGKRVWTLDAARTAALLEHAPRAWRMRVDEVLLSALSSAHGRLTKAREMLVELEGHGREDVIDGVDLSATLGWFTTQYPVVLPAIDDPAQALRAVRERLRAVPAKGLHFGLLSRNADEASRAALAALPQPEISFNYLGRFDQTFGAHSRFGFAKESAGRSTRASDSDPDRILDINGLIAGDRLTLTWTWSERQLDSAIASQLVDAFDQTMAALIDHLVNAQRDDAHEDGARDIAPIRETAAVQSDAGVVDTWRERATLELAVVSAARLPAAAPESEDEIRFAALPLNALGAPRTVFCFHPGHGMIGDYRTLAQSLNGTASLIAIQSPFIQRAGVDADWNADSIESMALKYASCIKSIQPHGPYSLLGWSFGGRVAAAVAHVLAQAGERCDFIGVVDTATHWLADEANGAREEANEVADVPFDALPADSAQALLIRAALRADTLHTAWMAQHTIPVLDTPLHVWRATRNDADPLRRMEWARHTSADVHEYAIDATHAGIVHHPSLQKALAQCFS
ncbi:non-ribosomal peptide synthase protein (TIGR01720 family)/amino acid adenylation domain-containing protein [Paraburkholderia eburnea]|uniref:Non-ribosomal peptide synthase protein (TIGR01720 family)/amino acid adenylation domain-containing protein n=1 Tax=Paraburkholderia eburnea TaxID=1189126 RepID=A0A2S4MAE1_9BURK|nr:non-ribosomal peptide synthetase [Paraburkholderia eburnea]POR51579.1 non-ribosomal peptide synthase protein (TIGR01720 family)/amino acid adenylation domain-containing protein [Paraburkholderia eburnea]PRZ22610.1 non-ribosomal peptide synthase protein (TIGR01720 family)/amino acid adenylation domain-containing protein [Paraburkholderia eburnea]